MNINDMARSLDGAGISAFLGSLPATPLLLGLGGVADLIGINKVLGLLAAGVLAIWYVTNRLTRHDATA